jgi:ketosteroid isomerase-like protein
MENRTVREFYDAFGAGDVEAVLNTLADGVEWNMPGQTPFAGPRRGRDQIRDFFAVLNRVARIDRFDAEEFIGQGDRVVALGSERITVRATGDHAEQRWAHLLTLADGRIARIDFFEDTAALAAVFGETPAERRAELGPMGPTEPPFSGRGGVIF